jgi:PKD repeat protein
MRSLSRFALLLLSLFIVLGCSFCEQIFESVGIGDIQDGGFYGEPQQFEEPQEGAISILPQPIFREEKAIISQPWVIQPSAEQLHVTASPAEGDAPLVTVLQVVGMQAPYWFWDLDWDGDGDVDTSGQGPPSFQLTYDIPGSYRPEFTFYNDANQVIASAVGFFTVTGTAMPRPRDILPPADKIIASPSEGSAPLRVTLDARSIAPESFSTWSLDQYSGGVLSYPGGEPVAQVIYENPGSFNATIVFYNSQLREISRGRASVLVREGGTAGQPQTGATGTSRQALTAEDSGGVRPTIYLGNETDVWIPPAQEISEDLKADLQPFPEQGSAPLEVRFDASRSFARNGISLYSYDIAWGPENREDDGYYLYSGPRQNWTYTFQKPGLYLAILDVEDKMGKRARITKVIKVIDSNQGLGPSARLIANTTGGIVPLTVEFTAQPQFSPRANEAAFAYWDFALSTIEPPLGGDISRYGTIVHTYNKPGRYEAGVTLLGKDRDAGPMTTITIDVYVPSNSPPEASISATPAAGQAPLQVRLDGSKSFDPEGKIARYIWYPLSPAKDPVVNTSVPEYIHVYTAPGSYRASLEVIDEQGLRSTNDAHVDIQVMAPGLEPKG